MLFESFAKALPEILLVVEMGLKRLDECTTHEPRDQEEYLSEYGAVSHVLKELQKLYENDCVKIDKKTFEWLAHMEKAITQLIWLAGMKLDETTFILFKRFQLVFLEEMKRVVEEGGAPKEN